MRAAVLAAAVAAALVVIACGGGKATPDACVAGMCGVCMQPNDVGVGAPCTMGGGECGSNKAPFLFCTSDYETGAPPYCTGPCGSDADCGTNAYCSGSGHGGRGCEPAVCGGAPGN